LQLLHSPPTSDSTRNLCCYVTTPRQQSDYALVLRLVLSRFTAPKRKPECFYTMAAPLPYSPEGEPPVAADKPSPICGRCKLYNIKPEIPMYGPYNTHLETGIKK
jgi:hypothetical protein